MRASEDSAFRAYASGGSPESLVRLLEAFGPVAFNLCYQVLEHRQDAEDASQQVLLEAARYAGQFPNPTAFRSWVYRVCLSKSLNLRRSRSRRHGYELKNPPPVTTTNGNGDHCCDVEARQALLAALAELKDEDRDIVFERYFEGGELRVIAERRGCSKVAIWNRLERIQARLRKRLMQAGLSAAIPNIEFWLEAMGHPVEPDASAPVSVRPRAPSSKASPWIAASAAGFLLVVLGVGVVWTRRTPEPVLMAGQPEPRALLVATPEIPTPATSSLSEAPTPGPEVADDHTDVVRWLYQKVLAQVRTGTRVITEPSGDFEAYLEAVRTAHRDPVGHAEELAEFTAALYEIGAEETGLAFSAADRRAVAKLRDGLAASLKTLPDHDGPARLVAIVAAELEFARGVAAIVPQDEAGRMMFCVVDRILKRGSAKSMPREHLEREIAADWTATLSGDVAARPHLELAADRLAASLARITTEFATRDGDATFDDVEFVWSCLRNAAPRPYDPIRRMEHQIAVLKAYADALDFVDARLDPRLGKQLRESEPWTYAVSRQGVNGLVDRRE